ncbi:AI-2E family transporter [Candidatus Saccharibacteria bacterium]|nr:AI-2E family transporter [Candidatus Saccharibacteria bacterium]
MPHQIIEVETKTFIRFWLVLLGFLLLGVFLVRAWEALTITVVAALLAVAIRPFALRVNKFFTRFFKTKSKVPIILAYLLILFAIVAIVAIVGPVIVHEIVRFVSNLPNMVDNSYLDQLGELARSFGLNDLTSQINDAVSSFSKNFLSAYGSSFLSGIGSIGSVVIKVVVTLIMSLFFLIEGPDMLNDLWEKLGARKKSSGTKDHDVLVVNEARYIVSKMAWVVSTFVDKKVLVAVVNGCATATFIFTISIIFHLENNLALPMGMIAMVCCIIPMFGQFVGGVTISLILLLNDPIAALIWVAFYSIYSVVESNIFEPKIQGDALNLRPLVVLIAITIGTYMSGFLGTIIAIPIAGCIKVFIDELPKIKEISKQNS